MIDDLEKQEKQERVVEYIKDKEHEKALGICLDMLNEDPDDPIALFQISKIMIEQHNRGLAFNLMARATKIRPDIPENWLQFGQSHPETPEAWKKSEWCFHKGIKLAKEKGKQLPMAWSCLGTLSYLQGNYETAMSHFKEALRLKPDNTHAMSQMAFTLLARGEWSEAWGFYDSLLKTGSREHYAFGNEPDWDGTPGKRLIITGEQGIGDEIMYASCFQECIDENSHVVIDCMPRLEKLFRRSFPGAAAVYGSRWDKHVVWQEDHAPDAHIPMASLAKFYRRQDSDFHGKPYLVPDPDMVDAVQGLFKKLGGNPKVGIAWTGGTKKTRGHLRARTLEELLPILRVPGIDWISLEYYNRDREISEFYEKRKIPIHTYEWLTTRGLDYDLTAALISQLDLVISVPTTSVQAAGGLGVECWVLVPRHTGWMFARNTYPWAASVTPFRNPPIREMEERLRSWASQEPAKKKAS